MKSNKTKYTLFTLIVICLGSCDIDRLPEDRITDQVFWRTENDLRNATNYLYRLLPGFFYNFNVNNPGQSLTNRTPLTDDLYADDAIARASNPISDGSRLAVPTQDFEYSFYYFMVTAANNIILKAPNALKFGLTQPIIDRYVAEARFFRAYAYMNLMQRYGEVVLLDKPLEANSLELTNPVNATRNQLIDFIYADLDFAAGALRDPGTTSALAADYGRVFNTAALALKARAALFEGTFAKYHGKGDANKHLDIAIVAADAVIKKNLHALNADYISLFNIEASGATAKNEIILAKLYLPGTVDVNQSHSYFRSVLEQGQYSTTRNLIDAFLMRDGLPIGKSKNYKPATSNLLMLGDTSSVTGRDSRLSASFFKRGDPYINNANFTTPNLGLSPTGFISKKYAVPADWQTQQSGLDRILIRYAEVLLIKAEATYELNGSITDANLDATINLLRTRAKMPKLTNAFVSINKLDMLEEIRRERRVELNMEGFRYWDLLRWKTAEIELPKTLYGIPKFTELGNFAAPTDPNYENSIIAQPASARKFNPARDYLWPIPLQEFTIDGLDGVKTLKQNPGW
jgi:starch-binding outer membrane protein, SusD/RagB family